MANIRLSWTNPPANPKKRPIKHVIVEGRVAGTSQWTEINRVAAPGEELVIADIAPGDWDFRAIVEDVAGVQSREPHPQASALVPFDPPDAVENFAAIVE